MSDEEEEEEEVMDVRVWIALKCYIHCQERFTNYGWGAYIKLRATRGSHELKFMMVCMRKEEGGLRDPSDLYDNGINFLCGLKNDYLTGLKIENLLAEIYRQDPFCFNCESLKCALLDSKSALEHITFKGSLSMHRVV